MHDTAGQGCTPRRPQGAGELEALGKVAGRLISSFSETNLATKAFRRSRSSILGQLPRSELRLLGAKTKTLYCAIGAAGGQGDGRVAGPLSRTLPSCSYFVITLERGRLYGRSLTVQVASALYRAVRGR